MKITKADYLYYQIFRIFPKKKMTVSTIESKIRTYWRKKYKLPRNSPKINQMWLWQLQTYQYYKSIGVYKKTHETN